MKKIITMSIIALFCVSGAFAQASDEKPTTVVENMYILPKKGMEENFEAAVKAHDLKFHPDGQYKATLRKVEYGDKSGWYVWVFGPTTYTALDTRPTKENGHADDWTKTIDPLVETYGETSLWNYNPDLSYGYDILKKSNYYEVWSVQLKRGQYYRFKAMAEKLKKTYESLGNSAFIIFDNPLHTSKTGDVRILWSFNTLDEWSKDPGLTKAYEKLYGDGSWQQAVDEWLDVLVDYNAEIRSIVK
jgi:hypothetical protein